jgi:AcrR family transcriptional regulator
MPTGPRRTDRITVDRIADIAFGIVAAEGYDALTMRRVATALETGPASLYAHVASKAALDDELLGRLTAQIALPEPDAATWRAQLHDVAAQLRDLYLRHPGISRAALTITPTHRATVALQERMLGIALAGGLDPLTAAWTIDALTLYVAAYALELSLRGPGGVDVETTRAQLDALPADEFPLVHRYARELTSGAGHERFDFTVGRLLSGVS